MKTTTRRILFALAITASAGLAACAPGSDDSSDPTVENDEYVEAIPNTTMLGLDMGDAEVVQAGQNLTVQQALTAQPGSIREHAQEVMGNVNDMLGRTHDRIENIIANNEPTVIVNREGKECKLWETDGELNHWALAVCKTDARAKRFGVLLAGKPLGAPDNQYKAVFAADAHKLQRHEGARRGHGRAGYNLDNLNALTGQGPTGTIGIGYRAAGPARQLNLGFKNFQPEAAEQSIDALYRFTHIAGRGGDFRFALHADFLTRDEEGDLTRGQDSVDELGRVVLTFAKDRAARAAAAVCGGTVGEGRCIAVRQCWTATGEPTFEETDENVDAAPQWEPTSCTDLRFGDETPGDDAMDAPEEDSDGIPAPAVPEEL